MKKKNFYCIDHEAKLSQLVSLANRMGMNFQQNSKKCSLFFWKLLVELNSEKKVKLKKAVQFQCPPFPRVELLGS